METQTVNSQIIIILTEHPTFGLLLIPYIAEKAENNTIKLIEQAFHASPESILQWSEAEQQAITIASHYTEKYLMEVYSKEKVISHFLHKLAEDPNRIKNNIRPFIEKKLQEMVMLIQSNNLPLYQKQAGSKLLYPHHAIHVHSQDTETHFIFNVEEKTFSYQLKCYNEGKPITLTGQKPVIVLTTSPAIIILGMKLYTFHHIESTRILPFTKKEMISVNAEQIEKYIENIIIPIARYHDITIHGLALNKEERECKAVLYWEETVYNEELLRLSFEYGDRRFTPYHSSDIKKYIFRKENGEISYFERNAKAESKALQLLASNGLVCINEAHFKLSPEAPEKTLSEWINLHKEMLQQDFSLLSDEQQAPYCLDEIRIEQECKDTPDWFELHITICIGNLRIPFSQFRKHIIEEKKEYLLPDGRVLLLPEEWFSKYSNLFETGKDSEKGIQLKRMFVGVVQSVLAENNLPQTPIPNHLIQEVPAPAGLKAQLRPYQQKGFSWLAHLYEQKFGGCLADDMGLGKTLQTLTLLQHIYKPKPTNLPESITAEPLYQYKEESGKKITMDKSGQLFLFSFSSENELLPDCNKIRDNDPKTSVDIQQTDSSLPPKNASLIVMPTSLLHNWKKETQRFTTLSTMEYNSNVPVPRKHMERLFGNYHIIFTTYGMMRNNIEILREYCFEYIILDESQNIKNSDSLTFRAAIQLQSKQRLILTGTPIENSLKDLWTQFHFLQPGLLGSESEFQKQFITPIRQENKRIEAKLQQMITPFILRRGKSEVAPELPALTEETIYCEMPEEQNRYYQQEKNSLRNTLLQSNHIFEKEQPLTILNGILRLRQLACHPKLINPDFIGESGKTEQIIETFDTLRSEGHKVLIFSSFVKHLELIAEKFNQRGWKYALLTGATDNRPAEIAHFTEQNDVQAFLISLKAGGVGLNLTQADYVFIIDPWWNPAAESQAIARAHRIGQKKQVIAYRFITQNSIEEKIVLLQNDKKKLAEIFISDNKTLPSLTGEEWATLL